MNRLTTPVILVPLILFLHTAIGDAQCSGASPCR